MQRWQLFKISGQFSKQLLPLLLLATTAITLPSCTFNQPPKPFSSEALPTEAIAEISEIRNYPVRVRYINTSALRPATVGVDLKVNESVSTDDSSTAQITLRSGAIFRIGGKSNLVIKPQNQVEFTSGRLIAWASSDRKAAAQIQTPFGEISSNSGTIYVDIPTKASEERRIVALDGTVTVLLKSSSEVITVVKGEELRVKPDGKASAPKRIDRENIDKYIANNSLIFGFSTQLASQSQIVSEFGVSATTKQASTIEFRRSDLPAKPSEADNKNKVTYTSISVNKAGANEARETPTERPPEPIAAQTATPQPTTPVPPPPDNTAPSNPAPVEPAPVSDTSTAVPVEPSQPAPLEPPPAPVQPEIPAPAPSP